MILVHVPAVHEILLYLSFDFQIEIFVMVVSLQDPKKYCEIVALPPHFVVACELFDHFAEFAHDV